MKLKFILITLFLTSCELHTPTLVDSVATKDIGIVRQFQQVCLAQPNHYAKLYQRADKHWVVECYVNPSFE